MGRVCCVAGMGGVCCMAGVRCVAGMVHHGVFGCGFGGARGAMYVCHKISWLDEEWMMLSGLWDFIQICASPASVGVKTHAHQKG